MSENVLKLLTNANARKTQACLHGKNILKSHQRSRRCRITSWKKGIAARTHVLHLVVEVEVDRRLQSLRHCQHVDDRVVKRPKRLSHLKPLSRYHKLPSQALGVPAVDRKVLFRMLYRSTCQKTKVFVSIRIRYYSKLHREKQKKKRRMKQ